MSINTNVGKVFNLTGDFSKTKLVDALDKKQDKLTGTQGQLVGFDADGQAVPQEAPKGGMTQEQADERYLKQSGGTVSGKLQVDGNVTASSISIEETDDNGSNSVRLYINADGKLELQQTRKGGNISMLGSARITGVDVPTGDYDAANKKYVDDAITAAIASAIEGAY